MANEKQYEDRQTIVVYSDGWVKETLQKCTSNVNKYVNAAIEHSLRADGLWVEKKDRK